MMNYTLAFVIPVYNHPHYIADLVDYLSEFQRPIIVVNDGSDVTTSSLLQELAHRYAQVTLFEHVQNLGKGHAVMTGLRQAWQMGFSHVLQLDADGQHQWSDVEKFMQFSQQSPQAMVIGQPIFDESVPKKRLYGRYLTHFWVWLNSLSFDIKDSMCGFRVYPLATTMQVLNDHKLQAHMAFDTEILVRLKWLGVPFINVPTPVVYPEQGVSHFRLWQDNLNISQTHARLFAGMLYRLPQLLKQRVQASKLDKPKLEAPQDQDHNH
ncbi:MAG: glycosyltransferase family 2 protein [Acinetobacter sp.]